MALYDNKYWLLSHIRNSFISTDDTGMCELVMLGEDLPKKLIDNLDSYMDPDDSSEDDDEAEHESYDLQFDTQFSRLRSDNATRMEKMAQAKKRQAKIKQIKWEYSGTNVIDDDLFVKKEVVKPKTCVKSLLSLRLENSANVPKNPFMDYAKFDGSSQIGIPTRKFKIFLTMLPEERRNYPIAVCCLAAAKIQEFIGLILLKTSTVHGDIPLKSVHHYGLYLTEDDGEVDRDFPCLDAKECVAKFSFAYLALVEHKSRRNSSDNEEVTEIINNLQNINIHNVIAQEVKESVGMEMIEVHNTAMESHIYKSFQVSLISKVKPKIEIHLGISGEKIEIDPVQQKNSKFPFVKQKAVSHHIDSIASCEIIETKANKSTFRIVYGISMGGFNFIEPGTSNPISFKNYDFEADINTVKQIIQKVTQILEIRPSVIKKEYTEMQEKKILKKKTNMNK